MDIARQTKRPKLNGKPHYLARIEKTRAAWPLAKRARVRSIQMRRSEGGVAGAS